MVTMKLHETTLIKRLTALAVLAAFIVISLLSSLYIAREADHQCDDTTCSVCAMIEQCENTLKKLSTALIAVMVFIAAIAIHIFAITTIDLSSFSHTLISQKVRLNN